MKRLFSHDTGSSIKTKEPAKDILQKQYIVEKLLGQGTNARVMKAKNKKNKQIVAVKIMKTKEEIEAENKGRSSLVDEERMFKHEIAVMQKVKQRLPKHPNIMELVKVCVSSDPENPPDRPCLVLEYLPGGELFDKIVEKSYYTEADAAGLFKILMSALSDLHEAGIVHRDLKPENIIFGESDEVIKICDFGTAKLMDSESEDIYADFKVGSPGYFAPETIYKHYHPANDVWSMGCILYTLLVGYMPFNMDDPMLIVKLLTCRFEFHEEAWRNITPEAKDLIKKMLSMPYKERITTKEVLTHPWFAIQKKRPSVANLGATLVRLKKLNDEKEHKKNIMRQYVFDNVLAARTQVTKMIAKNTNASIDALKSGLRRIASRKSNVDDMDMSDSDLSLTTSNRRIKKNMSHKNLNDSTKKGFQLRQRSPPRNRQALMTDIRNAGGRKSILRPESSESEPNAFEELKIRQMPSL